MWILLVVVMTYNNQATINMQEFSSQETCQAAGAKIWELTGRRANWSCVKA